MRENREVSTAVACQGASFFQSLLRDWKARLGVVAVLSMVLATLAVAPVQHASAGQAGTVDTDALSLRAQPNTDGSVLATMVYGNRVDVLGGPTDSGWYEVRFGGIDGYAYGGYLALDGASSVDGSNEELAGAVSMGAERWIDVDRGSGAITLYVGDVPQQTLWGVMGWEQTDEGFYATANGTYYIYAKNQSLTFTPYANAYITDWVGFDPNRANGFHSYTKDGNGNVIAGGDSPTGGCVALDSWSADSVYAFAEYGMRVEVHW
ncbi:MAG: SH3 domain-containing protein [Thermomicrobiales bacterium]